MIAQEVSTTNAFGQTQSTIDLKADELIFKHLAKSGVVYAAMSEEKPFVSFFFFSLGGKLMMLVVQ